MSGHARRDLLDLRPTEFVIEARRRGVSPAVLLHRLCDDPQPVGRVSVENMRDA